MCAGPLGAYVVLACARTRRCGRSVMTITSVGYGDIVASRFNVAEQVSQCPQGRIARANSERGVCARVSRVLHPARGKNLADGRAAVGGEW